MSAEITLKFDGNYDDNIDLCCVGIEHNQKFLDLHSVEKAKYLILFIDKLIQELEFTKHNGE